MQLAIYALIFCVFLAFLAFIILWVSRKKIIATAIEKEQLKIKHQKDLLENSVQVQESSNRRVAQDLHDSINSKLAAIRLMINELNADAKATKNTQIKIAEVMESVREISYNLMPPVLEKFGLSQGLEELVEDYSANEKIKFKLSITQKINTYSPFIQLQLYRILQELLQNSAKYSQADKIEIVFILKENTVQLSYTDNGKGFDMALVEKSKPKSLGIKNIKTRASIINGEHLYQTAQGKGFQFFLNLKMPA